MQPSQWADLLDRIAERFVIAEEGRTELEGVPLSTVAFVEFEAPMGRVRLEYVTKPRTIGEHALGSRRIGGETAVQKMYDTNDLVSFLRAFRWDAEQGEWCTIEANALTS
ncbi:MAG: hypothetical protein Q7T01_01420 [bacterium]|nr:hypothetical protein [bacterium]